MLGIVDVIQTRQTRITRYIQRCIQPTGDSIIMKIPHAGRIFRYTLSNGVMTENTILIAVSTI